MQKAWFSNMCIPETQVPKSTHNTAESKWHGWVGHDYMDPVWLTNSAAKRTQFSYICLEFALQVLVRTDENPEILSQNLIFG